MELVCKVPRDLHVPGEDWDSLIWHNGKLFSGSFANGSVQVWSGDLRPLAKFSAHDHPIYHMTPGPGTSFFTSSFDCTIKQWEERPDETFSLLAKLEGYTEPPRRLCFHNGRLYSGDDTGVVKVWTGDRCLGSIETMEEVWDLLVSEGEMVTVRHVDVTLFSLVEKDEKVRANVRNSIPGRAPLQFGLDSQVLCCVDRNENVINVHKRSSSLSMSGQLQGHDCIINAMVSTGKYLVTGASDNKVICWDLETLKEHGRVTVEGYVYCLAVSPDGKIYAAGENKSIACLRIL